MNIYGGWMTTTLGYKNLTQILFSKVVKTDGNVRETDSDKVKWRETKTERNVVLFKLVLLLTTPRCVIFKVSLGTSSASRPRSTQRGTHSGPLCGTLSQRGTKQLAGALLDRSNLFCSKLRLAKNWSYLTWASPFHKARIFP